MSCSNFEVKTFHFDYLHEQGYFEQEYKRKISNFPMVYILNNEDSVYVGETTQIFKRMDAHRHSLDKVAMKNATFIYNDSLNKSSAIHFESLLIQGIIADRKYNNIINANTGQLHNYPDKAKNDEIFSYLWHELKVKNIVDKTIYEIKNDELFKFSPYKILTEEQEIIANKILKETANAIKNKQKTVFLINGGPGTGKSILALNIMKNFYEYIHRNKLLNYNDDSYLNIDLDINNDNIKLICPTDALKKSYEQIFKKISIFDNNGITTPMRYRYHIPLITVVDEAHRLKKRLNLIRYDLYDENSKLLGLDKSNTQLDWLLKGSLINILFYSKEQTVLPSDVDSQDFDKLIKANNDDVKIHTFDLKNQMRVEAGNEYINYIKNILNQNQSEKISFHPQYDVKIVSNFKGLHKLIKELDADHGLCRIISGFSFRSQAKNNKTEKTIILDGYKLPWNSTNTKETWLLSKNSINEVGVIHTIQGFELNYAGVIIGNELRYDKRKKKIYVDRTNYYDKNGKKSVNDEELLIYIINIYTVLLSRGIKGTYIYVCDKNLKEYLSNYFDVE